MTVERPHVEPRDDAYPYWAAITTRWMDSDAYGHVNNAQYLSFFDTVISDWLMREGGMDPVAGDAIGLCVESQCRYHAPLGFPETIAAGMRVGHVGRSSVRYEVALYGERSTTPAAEGHFVHVFVDRVDRTPVPIPDGLRRGMETLRTAADPAISET